MADERECMMATADECETAVGELADIIGQAKRDGRKTTDLDRSISAHVTDLKATWAGRLRDGELHDIHRDDTAKTQITLKMSSDDLLRLTRGELHFAKGLATGKIHVDAGVRDLLKLRTLF